MSKSFPTFKTHEDASCFNCGGDLMGAFVFSGHANGRGKFVQCCEKCGMSTWYDIKEHKKSYADKHGDELATEAV